MASSKISLTAEELRDIFKDNNRCPKIASPQQFADGLGLRSRKTIYDWVANGRLNGAYRKRGKHIFILRDRAVTALLSGPEWTTES